MVICAKNATFGDWNQFLKSMIMKRGVFCEVEGGRLRHVETECGSLVLGSVDGCLCMCDWLTSAKHQRNVERIERLFGVKLVEDDGSSPVIDATVLQLDEYFHGKRKVFDIPVLFLGTPFQCRVWKALANIPYGESASYSDIAEIIGRPQAARAVASAIANNPISIIIPCHRVIGKNNSLTGYAGGLAAKQFLLSLETIHNRIFS